MDISKKSTDQQGESLHFLNAKTKQLVYHAISLCIDSIFAQLSENLIECQENDFFIYLVRKFQEIPKVHLIIWK